MKTVSQTITWTCDFISGGTPVVSASMPTGWVSINGIKIIPAAGNIPARSVPHIYYACPAAVSSTDPVVLAAIKKAVTGS